MLLLLLLLISAGANEVCAYFFWGNGCPHCAQVEPFLCELSVRYPDLKVHKFEIYENRSNLLLLQEFFETDGVPMQLQGVPALFIGDQYFIGSEPIKSIESLVQSNLASGLECPGATNGRTGTTGEADPTGGLSSLSISTVIGAAFVDSINPCAIAVLIILLTALMAAGDKTRVLWAGIAFTISIYIVYFLFGLGLFTAIQVSGLSSIFYKVIGVVAILIGVLNLKDFFWYGAGGFVMEIPLSWRPRLKSLLKGVTSPLGAFLMGFIVCFFELPCTGGPYFFILGLLAQKTTQFQAIPILLLYNLVFVIPLVVITISVHAGFTTLEKADAWKEKNLRLLHLIAGIVMVGLGMLVLLGLI